MSLRTIRHRIDRIHDRIRSVLYYPYFECGTPLPGGRVMVNGETLLSMSSNDYLGLGFDPRIIEASCKATIKYGTSRCGSRFLNGTMPIHEEAETAIATFFGKEKALLFTSGHQANLGLFQALLGKGDTVLLDKHCHASIYDGVTLAGASLARYAHNDFHEAKARFARVDAPEPAILATEGIFSMDGSIPDLRELGRLFGETECLTVIDEAHAVGILGAGRGAAAECGMLSRIDLVTGTFSKSLASVGGFVAGAAQVVELIKSCARSLIFTAAPAPGAVAAAMAALEIITGEPERIANYRQKVAWFKQELEGLGIPAGDPRSPIVPWSMTSSETAFRTCLAFRDSGFVLYPILPPATPPGSAIIRVSVTDAHLATDLVRFLEKCAALKLGESILAPG